MSNCNSKHDIPLLVQDSSQVFWRFDMPPFLGDHDMLVKISLIFLNVWSYVLPTSKDQTNQNPSHTRLLLSKNFTFSLCMYFTILLLFRDLIRKRVQYWWTQKHLVFYYCFFLFIFLLVTTLHNKRDLVSWCFAVGFLWGFLFVFVVFVFNPEGKTDIFREGC